MKKFILIAALMFGGFITANAQESSLQISSDVNKEAEARQQELQHAKNLEAKKMQADKNAMSLKRDNKTFKQVSVSEVPQTVKDALAKQHAGAIISKASVNKKGMYKLTVKDASQDSGTRTVYINKAGVSNAPSTLKN